MKAALIILAVVCIGLGATLLFRHTNAVKEKKHDEEIKAVLTNTVETTKSKLEEQERITMILETNLNLTLSERTVFSNNLTKVREDLLKTQKEAEAAAEAAKVEMAKRQARIDDLTGQIDDQTKKLTDLNTAIEGLGKQINETEKKLAASEGDRDFLLKELKRLQAEKAELERQFNDLAVLRSQVSKLKEELSVSRRLEWIRNGIYGQQDKKGAERLLFTTSNPTNKQNFNLNVELKQEGGAIIVPPPTNPPPAPVTPPAPVSPK
jgi:chromosome segregation ATPase